MAGIYIHVPWCRKVCFYCDFHFSLSMRNKAEMLECMMKEIELRKEFLKNEIVNSVYFGGGTPSVLEPEEIGILINKLYSIFNISHNAEITIEANPDDLSLSYLKDLKKQAINRLSIGIQSFFDDDLIWMNRRHDRIQAIQSIENSKIAGFDNINIDLIYGIPGLTMKKWYENIKLAFNNNIQHLSAYHLTIENKTVYFVKEKKGLLKKPDEESGILQFEMIMDMAEQEGFVHYEISNFSLPNYESLHNSSYWLQKPYLGIGPSAHSFNYNSRKWNTRNNSLYIKSIRNGIIPCTSEDLSIKDRYNEYILTSLRTIWGLDINTIEMRFGAIFINYLRNKIAPFIKEGKLEQVDNCIVITRSGKLFTDGIISDLFYSD